MFVFSGNFKFETGPFHNILRNKLKYSAKEISFVDDTVKEIVPHESAVKEVSSK